MTMTMREKMARGMEELWRSKYGSMARAHWESGVGKQLADAALDALMDPTEGMCDAPGNEGVTAGDYRMAAFEAEAGFKAMIRAAKDNA